MRIGNKAETRNKVSIRLGSGSNRNTVVDDETNRMRLKLVLKIVFYRHLPLLHHLKL